jgi:hypothetical protein
VNFYWTTRRHIPNYRTLHNHICESCRRHCGLVTMCTFLKQHVSNFLVKQKEPGFRTLPIVQYSDQNITFRNLDVLPSSCGKVGKRHLFIWIQWKQLIWVTAPEIYHEEGSAYCPETLVNTGHTIRCPIPAVRKPYEKSRSTNLSRRDSSVTAVTRLRAEPSFNLCSISGTWSRTVSGPTQPSL